MLYQELVLDDMYATSIFYSTMVGKSPLELELIIKRHRYFGAVFKIRL